MATFSELFSAENVNKVMADPRLQLGLQLLAASGPQQQDMSTGQRLSQAGLGFMQQRAATQQAQQLEAYRRAQIEAMQSNTQQRQAESQRDAELRAKMQDPAFLEQMGPLARLLARAGADPQQVMSAQNAGNSQAYRDQQLQLSQERLALAQQRAMHAGAAQGQKAPAMRQTIDVPMADGRFQRKIFDPKTNAYVDLGAPFSRAQKADPLGQILDGIPTENETVPDMNAGPGPAVPGLPGSAPLSQYIAAPGQAVQGPAPLAAQGSVKPKQPVVSAADANAPAAPKTKAEYDALPVGAVYIDPKSGQVFTKKARG